MLLMVAALGSSRFMIIRREAGEVVEYGVLKFFLWFHILRDVENLFACFRLTELFFYRVASPNVSPLPPENK